MNNIDRQTINLVFALEKRVEALERGARWQEPGEFQAQCDEASLRADLKRRNENLDRQRGCYIAPKSPTDIEVNEIRQTVDGKVYVRLLSSPAMVFDLKTAKLISAKLNLVIDRIEA